MANICFNCGKGVVYGTQHRHKPGVAGRQHYRRAPHTPKLFKPNLQTAYLLVAGHSQKVLLCTKCRRLLKEAGLIKVWSKETKDQEIKRSTEQKKVIEVKTEKPKKVEEKPVKKTKKAKVEKAPAKPSISVEDLVGKKK